MRRTTICRSNLANMLLAAALTGAAAPLVAQDTTATQEQPSVHLVSDGETLWTLAEIYFGDPLLWPEIYRLNTLVVEDPHWIFPGEELLLVPVEPSDVPLRPSDGPEVDPEAAARSDTLDLPPVSDPELDPQATPAPPPPPPTAIMGSTVFRRRSARRGTEVTVVRAIRRRTGGRLMFFGAGFLTEGADFPWADVLGPVGESTLASLRASTSAHIFEQIRIRVPGNATYHIGDSLLIARVSRQVPGWGSVVIPTGVARVVAVAGRDVRAEIEAQFERVADGQVAIPVEPYRDRSTLQPVPIENGMQGRIIETRDLHPVPILNNIVFIDRGRADGLVPGDIFRVLPSREESTFAATGGREIAILEIVHVRERSASGQLVQIIDLGVRRGAPVQLIAKMPS